MGGGESTKSMAGLYATREVEVEVGCVVRSEKSACCCEVQT